MAADGHRPENDRHDRGIASRVIGAVVGPLVPPVVDHVDMDGVLDRVDPNALLDRIDLNAVLERVDANALIERVDVNAVLERVDVNRLLERVDIDELMERVDLNKVLDRVDVNEVVARIDTDALIERTELGSIIARSTGGVFMKVLDGARSISVTLDQLVHGLVDLILRRRRVVPHLDASVIDPQQGLELQSKPAGMVTRFLAFLIDAFLVGLLFTYGQALFRLAIEVLTGKTWTASDHRIVTSTLFVAFVLLYVVVPTSLVGRTVGKGIAGVLIQRADGRPVGPKHALIRAVAFPLSFLLLGAGFIVALVRPDRRALHDLIADTRVVYAWDARGVRLRARAV
jgi:uncharacterized RDD family membrane protein YckC